MAFDPVHGLVPGRFNRRQLILGSGTAVAIAAALAACGSDSQEHDAGCQQCSVGHRSADGHRGAASTTRRHRSAHRHDGSRRDAKAGGILRVGTLGGVNDIIDGQHIVAKADIMRQVTGWEPLMSFRPRLRARVRQRPRQRRHRQGRRRLRHHAEGRHQVRQRQRRDRRRRRVFLHTACSTPTWRCMAVPSCAPCSTTTRHHQDRRPNRRVEAQAGCLQLQRGPVRLRLRDRARRLRALQRRPDHASRHRRVHAEGVRGRQAVDPRQEPVLLGHGQAVLRRGAHHRLRRRRCADQRAAGRSDRRCQRHPVGLGRDGQGHRRATRC